MSEIKKYDFSNMICPKPLIQTKALIKNSANGGLMEIVVPTDSALRLKEMVRKQDWVVVEERKEGHRHFITLKKK